MEYNPDRVNRADDKIIKYYQYNLDRGEDNPPLRDHRLNMMSLEQIYKILKKIPILHSFHGNITGGFAIYMILKNLNPDMASKMIEDPAIATEDIDIKFLMYRDEFIDRHHNYAVEQFMLGSLKTDAKLTEELAINERVTEREMDSIFEIINETEPPEDSNIQKIQSTFVEEDRSLLNVYSGNLINRISVKQITAYINNKYFGIFNAVFTSKFDLLFLYPNFMNSHKYYYDYIGIPIESDDKKSFKQLSPRYLSDKVYYDEYIDSEFVKSDLVYTLCDALVKIRLNRFSNRIIKLTKIIGRLYLLYLPDKYEGHENSFKNLIRISNDFVENSNQYITSMEILKTKFNEVSRAHRNSTPEEREAAFIDLYNSDDYINERDAARMYGGFVFETTRNLITQLLELDDFNQVFSYTYNRLLRDDERNPQFGGGKNSNLEEPVDPYNYKYYYNGINILKSNDNNIVYEELNLKTVEKDIEYIKNYYLFDMIVSSLIISGHINFESNNNQISLQTHKPIFNTNVDKSNVPVGGPEPGDGPVQVGGKYKTKRRYNRKRKVSKKRRSFKK
jgi:hypothetical protein